MKFIVALLVLAAVCMSFTVADQSDQQAAIPATIVESVAAPSAFLESAVELHGSDENEMEAEGEVEMESENEQYDEGEQESESEGESEQEGEIEGEQESESEDDGMAFNEMSASESSLPEMPAVPASMLEASEMAPPPSKSKNSISVSSTNPGIVHTSRPAADDSKLATAPQLVTPGAPNQDKWTTALTAVNAEIMQRANEINSEKAWTKQVVNLIKEYSKKHKKVLMNMNAIRGQVKELLKKKKQVQNAMIQRELTTKIKKTNKHLKTIGSHIGHLKKKQEEFREKQQKLQQITADIKRQLRKLRGEKEKKSSKKL